LKAQAQPTVSFICSSIVSRGDGIDEGKETSLRSTRLGQLIEKLSPLAIQHGLESLPGYIARAGTIKVIADLLVIGRDGLGNGAGGPSDNKKPARDLLASADFGKGAKSRRIEIES